MNDFLHIGYHSKRLEGIFIGDRGNSLRRAFLNSFIPLLLLSMILFSFVLYYKIIDSERIDIIRHEQSLSFYDDGILRDLGIVVSDLHVMAKTSHLVDFVNNKSDVSKSFLERRFEIFLKDRLIYDQIRYIDKSGKEVIRANFNGGEPETVSRENLQDKSDTYYFKETIGLDAGGTYLSRLDLNVEHGHVENPLKPVIRLATPLYDRQGQIDGILVINYLADRMLSHLKKVAKLHQAKLHLLDSNGYWLLSPDNDGREWGDVLGHENQFSDKYPRAFENIIRGYGSVVQDEEVFIFKKIYPLSITDKDKSYITVNSDIYIKEKYGADRSWILVVQIPDKIENYFLGANTLDFIYFFIFVFTLVVFCWVNACRWVDKTTWEEFTNLMFHSIEQGPSPTFITDPDGVIQYVNPAFSDLSGYGFNETVGKKPSLIKSEALTDYDYSELWEVIKSGGTWEGEMLNKRKDGTFYWVEQKISPIFNAGGDISHFVSIQVDTTDRHKLIRHLSEKANHDDLTGLINRQLFDEKAAADVNLSLRHGRDFTVLFLDIDHFKAANDRYGHHVGDLILKEVANCMGHACRSTDYVSRYGGEEFVIALPETSLEDGCMLAEKLRREISELSISNEETRITDITISIGVAALREHGNHLEKLLREADKAMYAAKAQGRNRVQRAVR